MIPRLLGAAACAAMAYVALAGASTASIEAADEAWQRGDYVAALNGYIQVLNAPGGAGFVERIALTTGELYETRELTADGRAPRFSPDGRFIVYETGLETSRRTRIFQNDCAHGLVTDLAGVSATFTPDGRKVAYLRIGDTEEIKRASQALEAAGLAARNRNTLVQTLTWLIARDSTIVVRDLASGHEMELLTAPTLLKTGLTYAADGRSLFFLGAKESEETRTDIYTIAEDSPGPSLLVNAGGLKSAPMIDPSGAALLYVVPGANPLRRPQQPEDGRAGGAGGAGGGTSRLREDASAGQALRAAAQFGLVDLPSGRVSMVAGSAPAWSRDGHTLAYVARAGAEYNLMVGPTTGVQTSVKRTNDRIDAPALSPDGTRIAWQNMTRDDWEIVVADLVDNQSMSVLQNEQRVTRDIQHDVLPRFVGSNRLIAFVGEPRHRRSYLYEIGPTVKRIRLFHNNTVRTIAPEYQWAVSPDGTTVLVGAERDGNTVSPKRGVYLIDLTRTVTKGEVLDRLHANLKSEMDLKANAARTFQPIAAEIRPVVARVSVDRIFGYEKALFDFDSKNITRPGNRLASEFLFDSYKSFGYEPEYQWFDVRNALGGKTANVVATLRGTVNPDLVYVVSSHYDSVAAGPGADDDSSGTAALLEAARVLARHPMPATIVFASMTGEEAGLLGSREFVRRAVEQKMRVQAAINNDMVGWTNDERLDNTIRYSNPGIRDVQHGAALLFTRLITYDALYWKGTDAASFYDAYGDLLGGIGSYPVLSSPYYHQATDLLEHENHALIAETSKTTVATLMLLASSPSRVTKLKVDSYSGGTASLSWARNPEADIASYVVTFGTTASTARRLIVTQPYVTLPRVQPGTIASVKAVNARGLEGWDWARASVPEPRATSTP